jgi:hypothetical protein
MFAVLSRCRSAAQCCGVSAGPHLQAHSNDRQQHGRFSSSSIWCTSAAQCCGVSAGPDLQAHSNDDAGIAQHGTVRKQQQSLGHQCGAVLWGVGRARPAGTQRSGQGQVAA